MRFCVSILLLAGLAGWSTSASAQPTENLLRRDDVRQAGSYIYYARGDAARRNVRAFTTRFYPGGGGQGKPEGLHASVNGGLLTRDVQLTDEGDNATRVPFLSGELTDGVAGMSRTGAAIVSGWINVLSRGEVSEAGANTGQFDVLFDLGGIYEVTKVVLHARDQGGHRWWGEQECFTADGFADPTQVKDHEFRFFASASIPENKTSEVELMGAPRLARYVNLRLSTSVSRRPGPTASMGGILYEVEIHGRR